MNSKQKGDIAEAQALAAVLKAGYSVLTPFGDRQRYDFVIDAQGLFLRVQVKTGRRYGGSLKFASSSTTTLNGKLAHPNYVGQIELFIVYDPVDGELYVVPVGKCGLRETCLSLTGRSRNQHNPLVAEEYQFPGPLAHLVEQSLDKG